MNETYMKIGEIAAFFNVSVKAIRIYEKKGIIKPVKVDEVTGYRYYSADQVEQINSLLELKSLGFTLTEINKIMTGKVTKEQFLEALWKKHMEWEDVIASANHKMDAIDSIRERFEVSKATNDIDKMSEEQRAWTMVKMVCVEDLRAQSIISEAIWL